MSNYKLSVIIPTFNLEGIIQKTFHSVQNQTIGFNNIELIFVDDNSNDNTLKFLKNYENYYSNVKVISLKNNSGFAGKPRNIGLENSTSDYILFLDGDDQLLIDSCEVLYNQINQSNSDMIIGGHINRYENGKLDHNSPLYSGRIETFTNVNDANLLNITPAICAKLFRKELLSKNNIKFLEGTPGQDLVFLLESILNSRKVTVLNNFYVYYRNITDSSVSFNLNEKYMAGLITTYSRVCDIFEKHSVKPEIQEIVLSNHLGFLTTQLIRSSSSKDFSDESLKQIVTSEVFSELSNKNIFKNNSLFIEFFDNIKKGNYNNRPLLAKIRENTNTDLINGHHGLEHKIEKLNNGNIELSKENNILKENNAQLTNDQRELQINYETTLKDNNQLQNNLNNLTKEHNTLQNQHTELTNQKNQLQNNLNNLTKEHNTLQNNLNNLTKEHNTLQNQYADLEYERKKIQNNYNDLQTNYEDLTENYNQLNELKSNVFNDLKIVRTDFTSLKNLQIRINDENKYLKIKNHNINKELNEKIKELTEKDSELAEIKSTWLWKIKKRL